MSQVLDAATRLQERAAEQRATRLRRAGLAVAALAVAGGLGWVLLASSLLDVERVIVTGAGRVTPAQVREAAAIAPGTPLARLDADGVRARVAELDPVAQVVVERAWPSAVRLTVEERRPAVGFLTAGEYVLIDADGVPFAREPRLPEGAVRLQVARPAADDPATRAALEVLGELPEDLREKTGILRATSPSSVSLLLRDGRTVVWGGPGRAEDKAAAAQALLRLPGTEYDVTSPDVVVRRGPGVAAPANG